MPIFVSQSFLILSISFIFSVFRLYYPCIVALDFFPYHFWWRLGGDSKGVALPVLKITRKSVAAIPQVEKLTTYYDTDVKGFGLRIAPTGARSWILEYRPGAGGRAVAKKRLKLGSPSTMSPEDARETAIKTLARVTLGGDPAAARSDERRAESVADIADRFLSDHVLVKRKGRTHAEYSALVERYIKPVLGSMRGSLVTPADVARLQAAVTRGKADKGNGNRTIANRTLAVLSAMFTWASKHGLVQGLNPVKAVERFKENKKDRYLTTTELTALGEALHEAETTGIPYEVDSTKAKSKHAAKEQNRRTVYGVHAVAAIRLLLLTGARRREILDLRWTEVDLERGVLFLPDSKTGRKTIVLSSAAIAILEGLPHVGRFVIASASAGTKDEKPRADLNKPWGAVLKRAGLENVRLHDLRHSFASIGVGGSLGLPIVGKLLGHTQATTTQRYAHLDTDPLRKAADAIGERISAAMRSQ
ncbi:site-specific integrase [Rhizobium sp. LjRoot30]|uniref:tyrosine-type recombinase/integrase n=1 Tax=Rhizobium sp. LjRoot30 TaxID=3342320 RepID=UPI003ECEB3E9